MEEVIKDAEVYTITNVEEPLEMVVKQENDDIKNAIIKSILSENVAVSVGNYIFIPPLENPEASSPDRTMMVLTQSNYKDGYVSTPINIDGMDMLIATHISRIVHEGKPVSVSVYPVEKFNKEELCIAFKNEFPVMFANSLALLCEHKSIPYILHDETKKGIN